MEEFKAGDQVELKSGGPTMTVERVGDYTENHGIELGALCSWFLPDLNTGQYTKFLRKVFACAALQRSQEEE